MERQKRILVVEDDDEIADILVSYIKKSEMKAFRASDGQSALEQVASVHPDLVLLDIQMPHIDGWGVLSSIRKEGTVPIIMLTALDQDLDKLMGLRLGADDYIVKPFNPSEVIARINAVLRRTQHTDNNHQPKLIRTRFMMINLDEFHIEVNANDKVTYPNLTTTEFKLLAHMARYPRKIYSREELLNACLPEGDTLDRTIDSHISKLRKKLEKGGLQGVPESIRGIGYRIGENG